MQTITKESFGLICTNDQSIEFTKFASSFKCYLNRILLYLLTYFTHSLYLPFIPKAMDDAFSFLYKSATHLMVSKLATSSLLGVNDRVLVTSLYPSSVIYKLYIRFINNNHPTMSNLVLWRLCRLITTFIIIIESEW